MKNRISKNNAMTRCNQFVLGVLILITLLCSCNNRNNKIKLIPVKDLVEVITELYVADGLLAFPPLRAQFSTKDTIANYLDIIQRHGLTKERMDKTLRYYFEKKPEILENIYDQVLTKLNEKQALLEKENISPPPVSLNLWTGPENFAVPESGVKDPVWFSIPVKDTGSFILEFTTVIYSDDQSINPKVTVFFWHADSTKTGFRINWTGVDLPKDGQRHNYSLSARNSDTTITHINGWLLDSDPKEGRWEKHAKIESIRLMKASVQ
ncbi:MAG: hypothetical protein C0408_07955 [Odoribacter sp.]|nr:hypothetical protein [Odoribacter sp.]